MLRHISQSCLLTLRCLFPLPQRFLLTSRTVVASYSLHRICHIIPLELLLLLRAFSRVRLCHPIDGSPPGSPVPGILQARTLEWVAISFSNAWKWKVKVKLLSRAQLLATPWTAAYQAPPSMGFSRQEYWSGVPLPSLTFRAGVPNSLHRPVLVLAS